MAVVQFKGGFPTTSNGFVFQASTGNLSIATGFTGLNRAVIIAAICLSGVSGLAGWKLRDADYQRHLKADARAALTASEGARKIEGKNEATATDVGRQVEEAKTEIQYVTRTIIQKVPEYVTVEADARCTVPLGFVVLHDAAATGHPPAPATAEQPNDADSGVALSEIVPVIADNYAYTRTLEAQVTGWQEWWKRVEADWPVK